MVTVTAEIDEAALSRLQSMLFRVAAETPKRLAVETRRAAVYICQSLRKRTKTAPKRARSSEIRAQVSPNPPRYAHSNSSSRALLRRWSLTRKVGTPDAYTKDYFVYTSAHRAKGGRMTGKNQAAERRELLRLHAGIGRRGLAKKSWGWIQAALHGAPAVDLAWKKTRGERRDPRRYVSGLFRKAAGSAYASIKNHLDYALDALKPGALHEAISSAAKRLEFNILNNLEKRVAT